MRINPVLTEVTSIDGMMNHFSLLLYQMIWERAEKKKNFVAVELGVSVGNSTVALLAGLDRAKTGMLFSYDVQDNDTATSNVIKAGFEAFWKFTLTDSIKASKLHEDKSVDLIFLDTDHEYNNTKNELLVWIPKLAAGGRILMHDTLSRPDGVGKAFTEFVKSNPAWRSYNIDVCCGLGVLIKP